MSTPTSRHLTPFRVGLAVAVLACAAAYAVRSARAAGIPTSNTLSYSGTLLAFGVPDNSNHTMTAVLLNAGTQQCTSGSTSVTPVNGQFTIPLSSCQSTVQAFPNLQVQLTIDGTTLGATNLSAVPYSVVAGTMSAGGLTGVVPVTNGGTGSSTQTFVSQDAATGEALLPAGTTSQRASSPAPGMLRYNSTTGALEAYLSAAWSSIITGSQTPPASCAAILAANSGAASGTYQIQPAGLAPMNVWCDMTDDGGGYTQLWVNQFYGNDGGPTFSQSGVNGIGMAAAMISALGATKMLATETISGTTTWFRVNSLTSAVYTNFWTGAGGTYNVTTSAGNTYGTTIGQVLGGGDVQFSNNAGVNANVIFETNSWTSPSRDTNHYWHIWPAGNGTYAVANGIGGLRLGAIYIK